MYPLWNPIFNFDEYDLSCYQVYPILVTCCIVCYRDVRYRKFLRDVYIIFCNIPVAL